MGDRGSYPACTKTCRQSDHYAQLPDQSQLLLWKPAFQVCSQRGADPQLIFFGFWELRQIEFLCWGESTGIRRMEKRIFPGPILAETAIGIRLRQRNHKKIPKSKRSAIHSSRHEEETSTHSGKPMSQRRTPIGQPFGKKETEIQSMAARWQWYQPLRKRCFSHVAGVFHFHGVRWPVGKWIVLERIYKFQIPFTSHLR